ncbi:MAG: hypothetical protein Fur0010_24170 [Bdellovibrio sp.]
MHKLVLASFITFSFYSLSAMEVDKKKVDCQRVADTARVYCDSLEEFNCQDILSCLKRRDSCLADGKIPKTKQSCEEYNSCLSDISEHFSQRCEFYWGEDSLKGDIRCMDKRNSWWRSTSCPGYTKGNLLRVFVLKEQDERDVNFDCSLVKNEYETARKQCTEALESYKASCMIGEEDVVKVAKLSENLKCEYFDNFNKYKKGQFAIEGYSKRVDNSGRKKAPIKDEGASGDDRNGSSRPK